MKLNLRSRILLNQLLAIALFSVLLLGVVTYFLRAEMLRRSQAEVSRARSLFDLQQRQRFEQLEEISSTFLRSTDVAAAVAGRDVGTVARRAGGLVPTNGSDAVFVAVADARGSTLAEGWGGSLDRAAGGNSNALDEFVRRAQRARLERQRGYLVYHDRILEALVRPLGDTESPSGYVVVAREINDAVAHNLVKALVPSSPSAPSLPSRPGLPVAATDAPTDQPRARTLEVVFRRGAEVLAASVPREQQAGLQAALPALEEDTPLVCRLGRRSYLAFDRPLARDGSLSQVVLVSQPSLETLLESLRQGILLCAAVAAAVCLGTSARLSRRVTAPLQELGAALQSLREGKPDVRVKTSGSGEVGEVIAAFNEAARELELRERYRGLLSKMPPGAAVQEVLDGQVETGGEARTAAVLFADVRGLAGRLEKLKPRELCGMLNHHLVAMTEIVHRHGGIVERCAGDVLVAVFGVPRPLPNAARAALCAAVEMRSRRRELNRSEPWNGQFELGFGVCSGTVIACNFGSEGRAVYAVWGAAVNGAARLCASASLMQILSTESTVKEAGGSVVATPVEVAAGPERWFEVGNVGA